MLLDQLKTDLIVAMKAKDQVMVSTLRLLLSAINNKQIELQRELAEEDVVGVIAKQVKERKESIEAYGSAGRKDLVDKEQVELDILNVYLPTQMTEEELTKIVEQVITETGTSSMADFGKVMGAAMAKVKGKADGNTVSAIVKKLLSG